MCSQFSCCQEQVKVVQVKRSNSQMRHKSGDTKPRQREGGPEYFETIDSGWTSRDSSSMDRSGSDNTKLSILFYGFVCPRK